MIDQLQSNGIILDLEDGQPFPITFAIADFTEPEKRKRDVSKKIKLPGTSNNCNFFAQTFGYHAIGSDVFFNASQKTPATYSKRGVVIMPKGIIKLDSAVINDGVVTFNITLFSESVDIFLLLSTINIGELGWSEYDHILNRANIKASWLTPSGSGYRYPLIERGNPRAGTTIFNTTDIVPYVHFKEVFEKVLDFAGITFTSAWLDSPRMQNLLFGFGGGDAVLQSINPIDVNQRRMFLDNGVMTQSLVRFANPIFVSEWNVPGFTFNPLNNSNFSGSASQDILSQYNNASITIARSGSYRIAIDGILRTQWSGVDGLTFEYAGARRFSIMKNGTIVKVSILTLSPSEPYENDFNIATFIDLNLVSGDVITFSYTQGNARFSGSAPASQNVNYTLTTTDPITIDVTSLDVAVNDGSIVSLFKFIPVMKCSDFFKGALRQFNLYFSNPDIFGNVTIEPLIEYYSDTDQFDDLTKLVDHSKPIEHVPIANDYSKTINWKFKESKDFDAIRYFDRWGERYGDHVLEQPSYYAKGELKIELPWSTIVPNELSAGMLVPRFVTINDGAVKPNKGAPRIAFWNGLKSGTWTFRNTDIPSSQEVLTTYPCIHHFDNWNVPTFDINFKLVNELYYTTNVATSVNCYSEYYEQITNELTSINSMLVKCSVKYNENDIKDLSFARLKMINGALFRLNIVHEFDSDFNESTRIELLKVLNASKPLRNPITFFPPAKTFAEFRKPVVGVGEDVPFFGYLKNSVMINTKKLIKIK